MDLRELNNKLKNLGIKGITSDSRLLLKDDLFVVIKGSSYDGEKFIDEAIYKGAKAILTEGQINRSDVPCFNLNKLTDNLPKLLSLFYDYPQDEVKLIGITGTDGKTTTASIIEYLFNQKYNAAYIGTNGIRYNNNSQSTHYTSLPICELYKTLRLFADQNINYAIMEVSSQGLVNGRFEGINFDLSIFTNLTPEHLDTHKTMDNYLAAKKILFSKYSRNSLAVINKDSPYYKHFIIDDNRSYSIDNKSDYQATNIRFNKKYTYFDLITPTGVIKDIKTNLPGRYNIYNVTSSILAARHFNIPMDLILKSLMDVPKIDGRLERITTNEDFTIYVDFAHTANAIKEVLSYLKTGTNNLICILGSAGGKDKQKRPLMGKVATSIANHVIFTSEDPRNEDARDIINDLLSEVKTTNYEIIINRKDAIKKAVKDAKKSDIIIILGKGNENYYEDKGIIYDYSDIDEVLENLKYKQQHKSNS